MGVSVPALDPSLAAGAQASAELATRAGDRLAGLLARLVAALPTLESCALRKAVGARHQPQILPLRLRARSAATAKTDSGTSAATEMDKYLGVNEAALIEIIEKAKTAVSAARSSL